MKSGNGHTTGEIMSWLLAYRSRLRL